MKAAALIVIDDIWRAQFHEVSDDSSDEEDNVNNVFYNLDEGDICIDALINNAFKKRGDTVHRQSACINLDAEYKTKKEKQMTVKRFQ